MGPGSDPCNVTVPDATTPIPPVFKTPAPEGPYRDEVVVEVLTMDGAYYAGTVTTPQNTTAAIQKC